MEVIKIVSLYNVITRQENTSIIIIDQGYNKGNLEAEMRLWPFAGLKINNRVLFDCSAAS